MRAGGACAVEFDHGFAGMKSLASGSVRKRTRDCLIPDLGHGAALSTDQELHWKLMTAPSLRARDECVEALDLLDQPLLDQEVKRAIDRGRDGTFASFLEAVQQLVGSRGRLRCHNQFEDAPAETGQLGALPCANLGGFVQPLIARQAVFHTHLSNLIPPPP